MKTLKTNSMLKTATSLMMASFFFLSLQSLNAQTNQNPKDITVSGTVSENGNPLSDVNVFLLDSAAGTKTDAKGQFTFPQKLKKGDVLLFSYLGHETKRIKIKDESNSKNVVLNIDLPISDVELLGAVDDGELFSSKKKN